jgi:hypothetical protein
MERALREEDGAERKDDDSGDVPHTGANPT